MFDPDTLETDNPEPPKKFWVGFTVSFDRAWTFLRHLLGLHTVALCLLIGASPALAADIFCGHDDDENASYTACTGNDKDHDGYTTDGSAGHNGDTDIDCDDTNWRIGTDAWVDAGGGQVKRCKSDGTYTTSTTVSALVASDIASTCASLKFIDDAGSTSAGCGAHGTPCDPRCLVDSGRACYVAPSTSNDCFWWLPGTYSNNATANDGVAASLFFVNNVDGTSGHPFINVADPTGTVLLDSPGTNAGNISRPLQFNDSDYWRFYGFNVGNGFAGVGVYFNGGSNNGFYFGKVYSVSGTAANNVTGINFNGGSNNIVRASLFKDNYDTTALTNENNTGIVLFSGTGNKVLFSSFTNTSAAPATAIKNKHGQSSATFTAVGNHISNFKYRGIGWNQGGATIERNYVAFADPDVNQAFCFDQHDFGGTPFWDSNNFVRRNICINGGLSTNWRPGATDTTGSLGNPALEIKYNLARDAATAYSFENSANHSMVEICYRCSDAQKTALDGKWSSTSNCFYNTGAVAIKYSYAGDSTGASGAEYANFAAWVAAGFDSGSFSESFAVGSDGAVTGSTNCASFGAFGDAGATTTTSTSTTTATTTSTTSTTSISASATNVGGLAPRYQ